MEKQLKEKPPNSYHLNKMAFFMTEEKAGIIISSYIKNSEGNFCQ